MSNYLAIATVTAALQRELQSVIGNDVSDARASMVRPDAQPGLGGVPDVGVNIFLYEIAPNAGLRNIDLPTRSGNGQQAVQRPAAALDLHYLLSFYGEDSNLGAQRVLGSVVRHLHGWPLLTRERIQQTVANNPSYLGNSNLADAVEFVRFSPLSLSLEELSKLWSIFFQTPYVLSTAYRASVVLIEEELTLVTPLPVQKRQVFVVPFQQPLIERLDPQIAAGGATLTVRGQNLRGDVTKIKFGNALATPADADVSNEQIKIALPGALQPGVRTAQVIHDFDFLTGIPANEPHHGFESNAVPFVLSPTITIVNATSTTVTVKFAPNVGKTQRVELVLNELNPPTTRPEHDYTFEAPKDNGITDPAQNDTDTIAFALEAVVADDYLVRVRVDGAESLPDVDNDKNSPMFGQYLGTPKITVP